MRPGLDYEILATFNQAVMGLTVPLIIRAASSVPLKNTVINAAFAFWFQLMVPYYVGRRNMQIKLKKMRDELARLRGNSLPSSPPAYNGASA